MKSLLKASLLIFLIVMLPISFAQNLVYDANGNLVTGDGFYREYNALNQLKYIRNGSNSSAPILEEFEYHPIEERVWIKKTFNATGNVTETVYYLSKEFVMLVNKTGTFNFTYVYLEDQLVAQVFSSSGVINQADGLEGDAPAPQPSQVTTIQFILTDHKGSVVAVTNASGGVIENTTYSPYGQIISGGSKSRYDYEGKEYDSVTKTLDFHFRKINPEIPPWQQPDTLLFPYDPQKLNRYMFERGNPWKNVDPSGHIVTKRTKAVYKKDNYGNQKLVSKKTYISVNGKKVGVITGGPKLSLKPVFDKKGNIVAIQPNYDYDVQLDKGGSTVSLNELIKRDAANPIRQDSKLSIITRNVISGALSLYPAAENKYVKFGMQTTGNIQTGYQATSSFIKSDLGKGLYKMLGFVPYSGIFTAPVDSAAESLHYDEVGLKEGGYIDLDATDEYEYS